MAEQWEYMSVQCKANDDMEETLMPLGVEGWEAVGFVATRFSADYFEDKSVTMVRPEIYMDSWQATNYRVLLKRRKP